MIGIWCHRSLRRTRQSWKSPTGTRHSAGYPRPGWPLLHNFHQGVKKPRKPGKGRSNDVIFAFRSIAPIHRNCRYGPDFPPASPPRTLSELERTVLGDFKEWKRMGTEENKSYYDHVKAVWDYSQARSPHLSNKTWQTVSFQGLMNTLTARKRMRPKASTPRQVIPRNAVSGVSPCITGERTQETQDRRAPGSLSAYWFKFSRHSPPPPPRPAYSI